MVRVRMTWAWLTERCGEDKAAPELGGSGLVLVSEAPGTVSTAITDPSGTGRRRPRGICPGPVWLVRSVPDTWRPPERMRILTIGGRAIRVAVRDGTRGWAPLLLCNGIGASLELFELFVNGTDPQRPVIRFDMPGIGGSPAGGRPLSPGHAAVAAGLLDQLGYEQADVLGISWGGGLAQQFLLLRRPGPGGPPGAGGDLGPGWLMVPGHPRVLLRMLSLARTPPGPGTRGPHRR